MPRSSPLDSLTLYRRDLDHALLTPEEERELGLRSLAGDESATHAQIWDTRPGLAMGLSADAIRFGTGMVLPSRCRRGSASRRRNRAC